MPEGREVSSLYFDTDVENVLNADEVEHLIEQFRLEQTRYVLVNPDGFVLAVTRQPANETGPNRNATLIFGPKVTPPR